MRNEYHEDIIILNITAIVNLIIIINRSNDNGFLDNGMVKNSVANVVTLITINIYKCESWTHSKNFKGFCAPYTNIIINYDPHQ
jgi:ribosomal protein L21